MDACHIMWQVKILRLLLLFYRVTGRFPLRLRKISILSNPSCLTQGARILLDKNSFVQKKCDILSHIKIRYIHTSKPDTIHGCWVDSCTHCGLKGDSIRLSLSTFCSGLNELKLRGMVRSKVTASYTVILILCWCYLACKTLIGHAGFFCLKFRLLISF